MGINPNKLRGNFVLPNRYYTKEEVDAERDRRVAEGFVFNNKLIQAREQDLRNISGAGAAAMVAIANGAGNDGDLRWSNPDKDFAWIAADNSLMPLDARTTTMLGNAAMMHVDWYFSRGRELKNMIENGTAVNILEDAAWTKPGAG